MSPPSLARQGSTPRPRRWRPVISCWLTWWDRRQNVARSGPPSVLPRGAPRAGRPTVVPRVDGAVRPGGPARVPERRARVRRDRVTARRVPGRRGHDHRGPDPPVRDPRVLPEADRRARRPVVRRDTGQRPQEVRAQRGGAVRTPREVGHPVVVLAAPMGRRVVASALPEVGPLLVSAAADRPWRAGARHPRNRHCSLCAVTGAAFLPAGVHQ